MLLELSVLPKGKGHHASDPAAELNKIIDASGLCHQAKNQRTVLEGSWEQLMAVAKKCHDEVLKTNQKFITVMRAVDGPDVAPARACTCRLRRDAGVAGRRWRLVDAVGTNAYKKSGAPRAPLYFPELWFNS